MIIYLSKISLTIESIETFGVHPRLVKFTDSQQIFVGVESNA